MKDQNHRISIPPVQILKRFLFLLFFCGLCPIQGIGQQNTPADSTDADGSANPTISSVGEPKRHSAGQAAWKSAVVPGWGQAYNHKFWKIPVVYAGLGGLGYWIYFNSDQYGIYRTAYINRTDDDPATTDEFAIYSDDQLLRLTDFYRRQLDFSVLLTVGWYALGIIDAVVDAYLFEFDVSDDLSLRFTPGFDFTVPSNSVNPIAARPTLSIRLNLR